MIKNFKGKMYRMYYLDNLFNKIAMHTKGADEELEFFGRELSDAWGDLVDDIYEEYPGLEEFDVWDFVLKFDIEDNNTLKEMSNQALDDYSALCADCVVEFIEGYSRLRAQVKEDLDQN